jgi:hypothetical protein
MRPKILYPPLGSAPTTRNPRYDWWTIGNDAAALAVDSDDVQYMGEDDDIDDDRVDPSPDTDKDKDKAMDEARAKMKFKPPTPSGWYEFAHCST